MSEELIARLEAATGPDRDIDRHIKAVLQGREYVSFQDDLANRNAATPPDYTASIDAALTLLHPQTLWAVGSMEDGPFARIVCPQHGGGFVGGYREAQAATVTLALCIAALKARNP